ncbi:MAG: hypothetical protein OXH15_17960 [Gammaproteobacteria bacterium]|nr:hypothetical protein [Gammaproteobacteria bacterium]
MVDRPQRQAGCTACVAIALATVAASVLGAETGVVVDVPDNVGRPTFASPHAKPIVVHGDFVYAVNTPADTVDVIDTDTRTVVNRINVGIDPVGLAVRPDGKELWVTNHVSDSVSVVDTDTDSDFFQQVIATVNDFSTATLATYFDEPVGVAFADDDKAYVALSTSNRIAVIDVPTRTVSNHLRIPAQDPRAITVRDNKLYVIAFESNNQTQLSGCEAESIDDDVCTFDAVEHVFRNNNVLSTNYDADIVRNTELPDRDLFIFDTTTDNRLRIVNGVGTLLYGLAVDSDGSVFVAQTDARNDANGKAGTAGDGMAEMENRAFLNQITQVDCPNACSNPERHDLEPLPPSHPAAGMALATPFGIQVSDDDATLVVSAAGSDKLFTFDIESGGVLGRVAVGAAPRGVALVPDEDGAPKSAWVLNAVGNTVSLVDLTSLASPSVTATVDLDDPTHATVKAGRIAFNDADASTTGTFSCESCHPDAHTDQLIWVLRTPPCSGTEGCMDQVPPRLTMPVRGARDTQPYHWDGIPGDPYGGMNTANIGPNVDLDPNCSPDDPVSCTRHLVDGSLATTMCELDADDNCAHTNDEDKPGLLDAAERDALATFVLSVPYPPAPNRSYDNVLTSSARRGHFDFSFVQDSSEPNTGTQTCGDCHKMPFLVSTNTPGSGMDAPTWRGAYDRWMLLPQGRLNIIDLMQIVNMPMNFPERDMWILAGASPDIWNMVLQTSTGFPGAFARQITLNASTANDDGTIPFLRALENASRDGSVVLQGEGVRVVSDTVTRPVAVEFDWPRYGNRSGRGAYSRARLLSLASAGDMVITLTARLGPNVTVDHPQPALWPVGPIEAQTQSVELPNLSDDLELRINARHVLPDPVVLVNGRGAAATVTCESGDMPACDDEILTVTLERSPTPGGLHFLQLQNAGGLISNDMMFFSEQTALRARPGNLIASGGTFTVDQHRFSNYQSEHRRTLRHWNFVQIATDAIRASGGALHIDMANASDDSWHAQISHSVMVIGGQEYTLCYRARSTGERVMTAYTDANRTTYSNTSGGQFSVDLTSSWQNFEHTFTIAETDLHGRVAFDFAQSSRDVYIDNVGLYEGDSCGNPAPRTPRL